MLATPSAVLITRDRRVAIILDDVPVATHLGVGAARYVTRDGYVGVQLAGETRIDEYAGTVR